MSVMCNLRCLCSKCLRTHILSHSRYLPGAAFHTAVAQGKTSANANQKHKHGRGQDLAHDQKWDGDECYPSAAQIKVATTSAQGDLRNAMAPGLQKGRRTLLMKLSR